MISLKFFSSNFWVKQGEKSGFGTILHNTCILKRWLGITFYKWLHHFRLNKVIPGLIIQEINANLIFLSCFIWLQLQMLDLYQMRSALTQKEIDVYKWCQTTWSSHCFHWTILGLWIKLSPCFQLLNQMLSLNDCNVSSLCLSQHTCTHTHTHTYRILYRTDPKPGILRVSIKQHTLKMKQIPRQESLRILLSDHISTTMCGTSQTIGFQIYDQCTLIKSQDALASILKLTAFKQSALLFLKTWN